MNIYRDFSNFERVILGVSNYTNRYDTRYQTNKVDLPLNERGKLPIKMSHNFYSPASHMPSKENYRMKVNLDLGQKSRRKYLGHGY